MINKKPTQTAAKFVLILTVKLMRIWEMQFTPRRTASVVAERWLVSRACSLIICSHAAVPAAPDGLVSNMSTRLLHGRFIYRLMSPLVALLLIIFECSSFSQPNIASGGKILTPAAICNDSNIKSWVSVSGFAHLLLFYRLGPTDLASYPSGDLMLKALTDEKTAMHTFGFSPFVRTRNGIRYYLIKDPSAHAGVGEAHRDQCLSTFADLNLPLSTPISLKTGDFTVGSLLSESIANYRLDQSEPAWTAMAYTKYLPPATILWTNRFREITSFSQLAQRLMGTDLNSQSCAGTHIFEALVRIDNADRQWAMLDDGTRKAVRIYIQDKVSEIVKNQQVDGSWKKTWCSSENSDLGDIEPAKVSVLVTGHVLQMLAEVNPAYHPPATVFLKGQQWIRQALNDSTRFHFDASWVCPFTHAAIIMRTNPEHGQ